MRCIIIEDERPAQAANADKSSEKWCIIIEDERPAQEVLKEFIGQCPALELK